MADTLATLIKMHKYEVDAQRRVVAELEALYYKLLLARDNLRDEMTQQKEAARADVVAAQTLTAYLSRALKQDAALVAQAAEVQRQIEIARDELQQKFAEQKKIELAKEQADIAMRQEQARRDQIEMDEIASVVIERQR